jgi:type I restriction enzyme S subunit
MHSGWRRGEFRDCISKITSGRSVNSVDTRVATDEIGVLKTSCVYNGYFDPEENKKVVESELNLVKCPVKKDNIIVSRMNTASLVGASGLIERDYSNLYIPDRLWLVTPKGQIDARWFALFVGSPQVRRRLTDAASGTSASMKNISQDVFLSMPVSIPPLPEQRKIAAILRTWDEAIEKLEALREAKVRRMEALRGALLFGTLRTKSSSSNWRLRRLGDVTHELTERNVDLALDRTSVMGVSNTRGIVPMREQTMAEDIRRYKLLPPLGFAYNPMRINVGSIAMNTGGATFLVSPDYVTFACQPGELEPDYLEHLRNTRWWLHNIDAGGSGSVRQRTYYNDLAALQLRLPELEEQREIISVLNVAKADADTTAQEITLTTRQKRALMQKLLTGEWRVNIDRN